jgi:hypothetical protein
VDIVIRVDRASGFVLPEGHECLEAATGDGTDAITLRMPGTAGATFPTVDRPQRSDEEVVYSLSSQGAILHSLGDQPLGYPWMDFENRELHRLFKALATAQGRTLAVFTQGHDESQVDYRFRFRAEIRRVSRKQDSIAKD